MRRLPLHSRSLTIVNAARARRVGYVEFVELETVQKALTLSGTKLLGIPIQVQYTEAEKNRQAREGAAGGGSGAPMTGGCVPFFRLGSLLSVHGSLMRHEDAPQSLRRIAQLCPDFGRHP